MKGFARDVLLEMKWSRNELDRCTLHFTDRGSPDDTGVLSGSDIKDIERSFLITDDNTHIPYHRIRRIIHEGKPVWIRNPEG